MKYKKSQQPPKVIRASTASIDISGSFTGSLSDEDVAPMSSIKVCHNGSRSTSPLGRRKRRIVRVSTRFLILTLMIVTSVAFIVGTLSRIVLLGSLGIVVHPLVDTPLVLNQYYSNLQEDTLSRVAVDMVTQLPKPIAIHEVPSTTFTSTHFPQDAARTSHTVHIDRQVMTQKVKEDDYPAIDTSSSNEEVHLPSGQHLLIDIKNVNSNFLNSEQQLAEAMVQLVNESKLTLLSYHCHSLIPMGVSCVGVLLESHVAFHTFPKQGVITMDLFTCGGGLLIPLLPLIKNLFGIPSSQDSTSPLSPPMMTWSHKLRGFRESPEYNEMENPLDQELGNEFLSRHDFEMKIPLASEETDFQHVDIYEYIIPRERGSLASYERSLSNDESYESLHPELYRPNKVLFLDGVQQSTLYGEAAYHEALVHPAMIAHANPKRVAIIGGGEGATLREVLKHKSVDEVVMIDIDGELVGMCREHLPEWSDCTDMEGSDAESCFDDSRSTVLFDDAFNYFTDYEGDTAEKFDVIIMDALDPEKAVEIVGALYSGKGHFVDSLYNALSDDGVFVVQVGESEHIVNPAIGTGLSHGKGQLINSIIKAGFASMHTYDEGHSHFDAPWTYLINFKDYKSRASWYRTAPEIDIQIHSRFFGTKSGQPMLHFFDAPTMIGYQTPPKAEETTHCRVEGVSEYDYECEEYTGFDLFHDHVIPMSHLEARKSSDRYGGRALYAARDIPQGMALPLSIAVTSFHVLPSTWSIIEQLYEWADEDTNAEMSYVEDELDSMFTFTEGYGYKASLLGKKHFTIDSSITTFCNHGCNGTANYGEEEDMGLTEMTVDLKNPPEEVFNKATVYSPVFGRHLRQILGVGGYTLRDIKKGEEIKCNYLSFVGNPEDFEEEVTDLRSMCSGESMGEIFEYEEGK